MLRASEFDYVVENGTGMLDKCVAQMSSIIDAEKARTARRFKQPSTDLPPPESVHS
jgi:guanylate kinase